MVVLYGDAGGFVISDDEIDLRLRSLVCHGFDKFINRLVFTFSCFLLVMVVGFYKLLGVRMGQKKPIVF